MPMTQHELKTFFCDKSTTIATFLDGPFGTVSAKDEFHKVVNLAEDNDKIWGPHPHIRRVELALLNEQPVSQEFRCPCQAKNHVAV